MAMTFDRHPSRVVRPDKAPPLLMTKEQRLEAFERAGINAVAFVRFTWSCRSGIPRRFVRAVLRRLAPRLRSMVGANFLFGPRPQW